MIDIKDLMYGDWVKVTHYWSDDDDDELRSHTEIKQVGWGEFEVARHYPDSISFEGVEITPDILEKSGFEYIKAVDADYWAYLAESPNNLQVMRGEGGVSVEIDGDECIFSEIAYINEIDDWGRVGLGTPFKYVHELQRILKPLGIKKEIIA